MISRTKPLVADGRRRRRAGSATAARARNDSVAPAFGLGGARHHRFAYARSSSIKPMTALITSLKYLGVSDRLVRRNALWYARPRRLLAEFERLDAAARESWREQRLQRMLAAAGRTAYGRQLGAPGALADWPVLEKATLRERPEAFLARPAWLAIAASTSGTTGMPLCLRRSLENVAYEQAVLDHLLADAGVSANTCRAAVLRGDDIKSPADRAPPFWRLTSSGRRLVFSSNHLDRDTVGAFVEALRGFAPDVLFAYPSVLDSLCSLMLEQGLALRIGLTACGSEILTKATADMARAALATRVIGYYGQAERVAWAYGDPHHGFRFLPSYSVNELRLVESSGELDTYEIVGTGLWNTAMPLVRYATGDRIRVRKGASPAAVAEGRERFPEILGRSGDYILSPSGARLLGIDHIPRGVPHVVRTQFIQESASAVRLLVIAAPGFDEGCRKLLLKHASLKLPPSMSVAIETTTQLVRNGSGKAPLVVRSFQARA
jgi:phenylacetate-CoA ligase